jgi:CBS domain-containing protein
MNESKKEEWRKAAKELIKTPMEKTILFTTVFIILLIVFSLIKNSILAGATIDATIIVLAILPFIIYLAVSGKISEIRGGEFGVKFNNASNAEILFKSEEVVCAEEEIIAKGGVDMLRSEIMPKIAKDPCSTLSLVPGEKRYKYTYIVVKEYLEELTKFDFFKYVLFVDENNKFKGYIYARNLLAQLLDEDQGEKIINKINNGDVKNIPGFRGHYIKDNITNREALKDMEEKGITDIAVVDRDMKFKGFTNQDKITTRIINNLMIKPV